VVESLIYNRLSTFAGLSALVNTRVYPLILPQGVTYPAVTYQRTGSEPRESCMLSDSGFAYGLFRVIAWDNTYAGARAVAKQVRLALQRWQTAGVQDTYIINDFDTYDEEAQRYGGAIEAQVVYDEEDS
jgi:hypothetical protein